MATSLSDRPATNLALSDRPATRLTLADRPVASGTVTAIAIGIASASARLATLYNARAEDAVGVGAATADSHFAWGTTPVGAAGIGAATADPHVAYGTAPVTSAAVGAATAAGVAIYNATGAAAGAGSASADVHTMFRASAAAAGAGSGSADVHTLFRATATAGAVGAATATCEAIYNATASGAAVGGATATGTNTFQATTQGSEISDATRTTNTQGDGRKAINLIANGGLETNATGWNGSGTNTIARSTAQAKFGTASLISTYGGSADSNLGYTTYPVASGVTYVESRWIYLPSSWDGGNIRISPEIVANTIVVQQVSDTTKRDQWQRIQTVFTTTASGSQGSPMRPSAFPTSGRFFYADGAQAEIGLDATNYIETNGGASAPTVNDSSFGVWDATTNLNFNGGLETNLNNIATNFGDQTTTRDTSIAKFGAACVKATNAGGTFTSPIVTWFTTGSSIVAATTYTFSVWLYIPSNWDGGNVFCQTSSGAGSGAVDVSGVNANMGIRDQWQRMTKTVTTGTTPTDNICNVRYSNAPTAGRFIYLDGAQLESKAYASPYVHTDGATASRGFANVQLPAPTNFANGGWYIIRWRPQTNASEAIQPFFMDWRDGGNTSNYALYCLPSGGNAAKIEYRGSGVASVAQQALTYARGVPATIIGRWVSGASGSVGVSVNGAAFTTTAAVNLVMATMPANVQGKLNSLFPMGEILYVAMGNGTLTNSDPPTVNGWGSVDPTWAQLVALNGGAANPTILWTADTATVIKA